ncbi:hypothetical protein [Absiella sp. AM29-15]|uniref:hypothetical protein n=1 Tax=Absiella sp. AM29-15 TaxID=2292278 RepID=UPI0011C10C9B|nr:hypothetical protein [Absiella sp. AM29-15]
MHNFVQLAKHNHGYVCIDFDEFQHSPDSFDEFFSFIVNSFDHFCLDNPDCLSVDHNPHDGIYHQNRKLKLHKLALI